MKLKWYLNNILQEALKYSSRGEFEQNSRGTYNAAKRSKLLGIVCKHMVKVDQSGKNNQHFKWTTEILTKEALKYSSRSDFKHGSSGAYYSAIKRNVLGKICKHMSRPSAYNLKWTEELIRNEALKFNNREEFQKHSSGARAAAIKMDIYEETCSHMKKSTNASKSEINISIFIKKKFPKAQKLYDRKVKIEGKPHIKGFDIDIYIPELRKGIEFDGTYWHSVPGLKRSRIDWPEDDLENYHKIKDDYFLSKNVKIYHIKEEDWRIDPEQSLLKVLEFLRK